MAALSQLSYSPDEVEVTLKVNTSPADCCGPQRSRAVSARRDELRHIEIIRTAPLRGTPARARSGAPARADRGARSGGGGESAIGPVDLSDHPRVHELDVSQ